MEKFSTRVSVIKGTEKIMKGGSRLALEYCLYVFGPNDTEHGYRFIWKRPEGQRIAHRGQARIPSKKVCDELWKQAHKEGWDHYE